MLSMLMGLNWPHPSGPYFGTRWGASLINGQTVRTVKERNPSHPNYPFVVNQWNNNKPARPRSVPCLNPAITFLKEENPILFPTISLQQNLKPWLPPNFDSSYLPLSKKSDIYAYMHLKKSATLTLGEANSLFLSFFHALPPGSISAFTDGSLSQQNSRAAAAFSRLNLTPYSPT